MKNNIRVAYLCDGKEECLYRPMCIFRGDPVTESDDICSHTENPEHAKYRPCEDPENHPERFQIIQEYMGHDGIKNVWYWEPDEKSQEKEDE